MTRIDEIRTLESAIEECSPDQLTGAYPWTVHNLTAHLAAGADEVAKHVEALLAARPFPETRQGDDREQQFRDMPHADLRAVLRTHNERLQSLLDEAIERDANATIVFAGTDVPVWVISTHARLEAAVHRWDLVGDDDVNDAQLASPELTGHSVLALGGALLDRGLASFEGEPTGFRLRAVGQPDVVIQVRRGAGAMVLQPADSTDAQVWGDPVARLLLLWGRRSTRPGRLRTTLAPAEMCALSALLQGF